LLVRENVVVVFSGVDLTIGGFYGWIEESGKRVHAGAELAYVG